MKGGVRTLAHYARWIERRWSAVVERPVLSSADWELIRDWHARRIPLELIDECIADASARLARSRARKPPRGLGQLARRVDEAWQVVASGRSATTDETRHTPPRVEIHGADELRHCWARARPSSPLRALLGQLIAAGESGTPPAEIERLLDEALPQHVPSAVLAAVELEIERDLARYRAGAIDAEHLEHARVRARAQRLRHELGLPRFLS